MVICDRPIVEVCPVEWARKTGRTVLQWDKDDCAAIGLVKFDLLGLGMLEALHHMVDLIAEHHGEKVDLARLPQERAVYDLLCRADTVGVFQVESRAQMGTLPRMKPLSFYDLAIEVALIRPGPIQGNAVHPYLRRRNGEEEVTYLHPLLEPALKRTLGVPLFQEQLMQIVVDAAKFSATQADELRQAMSSKRSEMRMERLKDRLFQGMHKQGIDSEVAESIWVALKGFANFGFPESHAIAFAHLVYCTAWCKVHYPAAFTAGLLNAQPMGFWSPQSLVADAKRHGVEIRRPDVNLSRSGATLEICPHDSSPPAIRLGLSTVRSLGDSTAKRIAELQPWSSQQDLVRRGGVSTAQLESMSIAGALDDLHHLPSQRATRSSEPANRRALLWAAGAAGQGTSDRLPGVITGADPPPLSPPTELQSVADDLWALGLAPETTAIELARPQLQSMGVTTAIGLLSVADGEKVKVAGAVTHRQQPETARGAVFINLEDETGMVNVVCSSGAWIRWRSVARSSPALVIRGRLRRQGLSITISAERIDRLELRAPAAPSRDFH
jgi:error-prone DNA polymerase